MNEDYAAGAHTAGTADREIVIVRRFDAPRELVFDVWTDPKHVDRWWGPNGFKTTTHEMDARPGGVWIYTMHGPDGVDYPNRIEYVEVERPARLVYRHGERTGDPHAFDVTVRFEEDAGRTAMTMRMLFGSAEQRQTVIKFGAVEAGNQTMDRLAEYVRSAHNKG